jgi:hypothetical protein
MSALGQKQTSGPEISMSALPPKADISDYGLRNRSAAVLAIRRASSSVSNLRRWSDVMGLDGRFLQLASRHPQENHSGPFYKFRNRKLGPPALFLFFAVQEQERSEVDPIVAGIVF